MKNESELALTASSVVFKTLSKDELSTLLPSLYLALDFDARRVRFCSAVSDDSVLRHCRGLVASDAVVLGCTGPMGLIAAIELYPVTADWEHVELAVVENATTDKTIILSHLLQLAAFAAGKRGCNTIHVANGLAEVDLLWLLRGMGRVRMEESAARVDIGDYACLHSLAITAA
jgi:hypothetical protein